MAALSSRLAEIFEAIVDMYDAQPEEHRRRLIHRGGPGGREGFFRDGWPDDAPRVSQDDLDDLDALGLIDIDCGSNAGYRVKPSPFGREELERVRRQRAWTGSATPVDLNWSAVRPVLHAVVDIWTQAGALSAGYVTFGDIAEVTGRDADDFAVARVLEALAEDDWIRIHYLDGATVPTAQPTRRAILATRGWPGGDGEVAAERLLAALDDLADSDDASKRGWATRAREVLMEVGTKTLAEVVSKSAGGAI